jgi:hypothetical protein
MWARGSQNCIPFAARRSPGTMSKDFFTPHLPVMNVWVLILHGSQW